MSKHYDIKHVGKGKWAGRAHLHLATESQGYETVTLETGATIKSIPEERITDQVRELTKPKRDRPVVVQLIEIDQEAREADEARQRDELLTTAKARKDKTKAAQEAKAKEALKDEAGEATSEKSPVLSPDTDSYISNKQNNKKKFDQPSSKMDPTNSNDK